MTDAAELEDTDWYERRGELDPDQVFRTSDGIVKLDRRVPGDGTKWYVADWVVGGWAYYDGTIEPGELKQRLPDNYSGGTLPEPRP